MATRKIEEPVFFSRMNKNKSAALIVRSSDFILSLPLDQRMMCATDKLINGSILSDLFSELTKQHANTTVNQLQLGY